MPEFKVGDRIVVRLPSGISQGPWGDYYEGDEGEIVKVQSERMVRVTFDKPTMGGFPREDYMVCPTMIRLKDLEGAALLFT